MNNIREDSSVDAPWYRQEIGPHLRPPTRHLLETYSGLQGLNVERHLYGIVCA